MESEEINDLPANYVTINHLKEQWLAEKERQRKEKEEQEKKEERRRKEAEEREQAERDRVKREAEERDQAEKDRVKKEEEEQLRRRRRLEEEEEEAKLQKTRDGVVSVAKSYGKRFKWWESRPVDRSVKDGEGGAELEPKIRTMQIWHKKTTKNIREENEEVSIQSDRDVNVRRNQVGKRNGVGNRAKSKDVSLKEEIIPKLRVLSMNCETQIVDEKLGRDDSGNVGVKEELKGVHVSKNGGIERGGGKRKKKKPKRKNGGAKEEVECELKVEGSSMDGESNRGDDKQWGRPKSENVGVKEEAEPKVGDVSLNGKIGSKSENVGVKDEAETKVGDVSVNGKIGKGADRRRRGKNYKNGGVKGETKPEVGGLTMDNKTERGDERWRGMKKSNDEGVKDVIEPKVGGLSMNAENERGDERGRRVLKSNDEAAKDVTEPKVGDISINVETERGDGRQWKPRRFGCPGNGEIWGHKRQFQRQPSLAWVKKGEGSAGIVGGVKSSEHFVPGSTGTSSDASSLRLARGKRPIQYRGSETNVN